MSTPNKGSTLPPVQSEAQTQVQPWQPKEPPKGLLDSGALVVKPGAQLTRQTGKNKGKAYTQAALVVALPKRADLMATGLTAEQASDRINAIGKAIKPTIMGQVVKASSDDSYIVRRFSHNPDTGSIGLAMTKVKTTDRLAQIAAEYGLTREEVAKRLGVKEPVTIGA